MLFQKGHPFYKGGEKGWFKKGQHTSPKTEFKKGFTYWLGKKRSQETINKLKISSKGKHYSPNTEFKKGENLKDSHPNWKGGKFMSSGGYIFIYYPNHPYKNTDGYIFEHRLVMEKKLGRYLTPQEVVHHINNIHNDNRPENLKLFSCKSEHAKFHHSKAKKIKLKTLYL